MADSPLTPDAMLDAAHRAEAIAMRQVARQVVERRVGRALTTGGKVALGNPDALDGILGREFGGTGGTSGGGGGTLVESLYWDSEALIYGGDGLHWGT